MKRSHIIAPLLGILASPALAHKDHWSAVAASVGEVGFSDIVTVTCSDTHATLTTDTYPDHDMMTGNIATNEQVPGPAK